jgi:hypothetical protein
MFSALLLTTVYVCVQCFIGYFFQFHFFSSIIIPLITSTNASAAATATATATRNYPYYTPLVVVVVVVPFFRLDPKVPISKTRLPPA